MKYFPALLLLGCCAGAQAATVLEGRYEYRTDPQSQDILGQQVCFFPDDPRALREAGDGRVSWFCFSNSVPAAEHLAIDLQPRPGACGVQGRARVEIEHYQRYHGEGDGNDSAILTEVLQAEAPSAIACP